MRNVYMLLTLSCLVFKEPARLAALRRGNAGSVTGVGLEVGFDTTSSSSAQSELVVRGRSARQTL